MSETRTILKTDTETGRAADAAKAVRALMEEVRKLSEEAHRKKEPLVQAEEPPRATTIAEHVRLKYLHEASRSLQSRFSKLDTTDNSFLGQHELTTAFHSDTSIGALQFHYPLITSLHADGFYANRRRWISNDHLGVSGHDLQALQDITSSNPADRARFLSNRAWSYSAPGVLGGGIIGTVGTLFATSGYRRGWIGLGAGLGIAALSYGLGRWKAVDEYDGTRSKLSKDTGIDLFIRQGALALNPLSAH